MPEGFVDALKRLGEESGILTRGLRFCGFCSDESDEAPSRYRRTAYFCMGHSEIHVEKYSARPC